jgi:hypothetical protein
MCVSLQVCACAGKLPSPVVLNSKASAQRLHHAKRKFYRPSADSGKESCSHISIHFPTSSSWFPSLRHWKKILQKILETVLPQLQLRESAGPTIMDRRSSSMEFRKFGSSSSTFCIFPRLLMQVGKMILRGWLLDEENPTGNVQFRLWDAGKPPFQFLESVQLKISEGCSGRSMAASCHQHKKQI